MKTSRNHVNWKCVTTLLVTGCLAVAIPSQAQADIIVDDFNTGFILVAGSPPSPISNTDGPTAAGGILGSRDSSASNTGPDGSNSVLSVGGGMATLSSSIPTTASMQILSYSFPSETLSAGDQLILNVTSFNAGNGPDPDLTVTADSNAGVTVESFPQVVITSAGQLAFDFGDLTNVDITDWTSLELKFNLEQGVDLTLGQGIIVQQTIGTPEPSAFVMMAIASLVGLGFNTGASRRRRKR